MTGTYLYPHLGGIDLKIFRIAGPGLGNSLFPWARCISDSHKYNLPILEPSWLNLKPGSWLRCERDKRTYFGLFKSPDYYKFVIHLPFFMILPKILEKNISSVVHSKKSCIVIYKGMSGFFTPIIKDYTIIKKEIEKRVISNVNNGELIKSRFIAVHVRLGDFSKSSSSGPKEGQDNHRIPMWWYVDKIMMLRKIYIEIPVLIFSDGSDQELKPLLAIDNCHRAPKSNAINDILTIAHSCVFIASGSTFSMWASYLGRMPVIWFPGQMRQRLYFDSLYGEIESGKGDSIPDNFHLLIKKRWNI